MPTYGTDTAREAVGIFQNMNELQDAVRDLEGTAFPRQDISIQGKPGDMAKQYGQPAADPLAMEEDPDAPREAPVRPEEQTIGGSVLVGSAAYLGVIVSVLAWKPVTVMDIVDAVLVGLSVGALAGFVALEILIWYNRKTVKRQLDQGGLVLWVRTPDEESENTACNIMRAHGATHIIVHNIQAH